MVCSSGKDNAQEMGRVRHNASSTPEQSTFLSMFILDQNAVMISVGFQRFNVFCSAR